VRLFRLAILWLVWTCTCGCDGGRGSLYQKFQHEDPSVRISAIVQAERLGDAKAFPYLVDRLTDSEADVRFFAIVALKRITGRGMGYRYYDSPAKRAEAVMRWRNWLKGRRGVQAPARPGKEPGP